MPLLTCDHVSKSFGAVRALENVSFELSANEIVAVVGGSGCGKSTLARLICGLIRPDAGTLLWEDRSLDSISRRQRATWVQMVFQDPYASLNPKLTVGTQLREVVKTKNESVALLKSVGLEADALTHYPFQFSGGQRQRIAIARALAQEPRLLIADEPLSALDVTVQAQILDLFRRLKQTRTMALLFITHDLAVAAAFAQRVLVLEAGRLIEEGPAAETLAHPQTPYAQALVQAVPTLP